MHRHTKQLIVAVLGPIMVAACSGTGKSSQVLQDRLNTRLAAEQAQHQVSVQPTADGAQVNFDESVLFLPGQSELSPSGRYVIASFTEAMLAPSLMQISVAGSDQTADFLRRQRVQNVLNYAQAYSLSPLPVTVAEPIAAPAGSGSTASGMTVVVHVACPPGPQGTTWGYPPERPTCN